MLFGKSVLVSLVVAPLWCRRASLLALLSSSFLLSSLAFAQTNKAATDTAQSYKKNYETLILHTRTKGRHKLSVEIAATPLEQQRGLMFRTRLPSLYGMLFLHDPPQQIVMWMKNTYLSLDMIFLDREGKVVQIVERTTPLSLRRIRTTQPVAAVLEVAGGSVERFQLQKGDRVEHRFFAR